LWGGTNYNPTSRFIGEIPDGLVEVLREAESPRERGWFDRSPRAVRRAAEAERSIIRVSPGDRVYHEAFGTGEVVEVSGSGTDAEVVVRFEDEGEKRLMLAYANLSRAG
jgi:DNA helicase-2/ATP-dependent DNA helicase PcrA